MTTDQQITGLQLRSLVKKSGEIELSLARQPVPEPAADQLVVRVEAAPINPSDLALLVGPADLSTVKISGTREQPVVTAAIPPNLMRGLAARVDQSLPVGNEGAGVVIKAGSSPRAKRLVGKAVAMLGGAMYAQYRLVNAADALVLPNGATPTDGASCFVNPLTSLGMTETMRREGHTALVHTAAASNLGQMLNKICIKDKIPLVNIVRTEEQAKLLRGIGAAYICNSTAPTFMNDLTEAVSATGATIAFDAVGGGKLASQILSCMEAAAARKMTEYSRYGSSVFKQVYIYGGLDTGSTELTRSFGLSWSVSGWLLMPFLMKIGPAETKNLRDRVARELKTTFASHYTKVVSLQGALKPEAIAAYAKRATGEKYLINPSLGA
jgi:NADPH:quinone reductase-like Zn-dependent oxidoreductase